MTGEILTQTTPALWVMRGLRLRDTIVYPLIIATLATLVGYIILGYTKKKVMTMIYDSTQTLDDNIYKKKVSETVGGVIDVVGWSLVIMIAMNILGLNMTLLMGGISFGIGFAMEKTFSNLVGAILLITNTRIHIGKTYAFQGSINQIAKRESINPKYSVLRLLDKTKLLIPNSLMVKTPIKYISQEPLIRMDFCIGVSLHTDITLACHILKETINSLPDFTLKEQTFACVQTVEEGHINLVVYCYRAPKQSKTPILKLQGLVKHALLDSLRANGIDIPYPHRVIEEHT